MQRSTSVPLNSLKIKESVLNSINVGDSEKRETVENCSKELIEESNEPYSSNGLYISDDKLDRASRPNEYAPTSNQDTGRNTRSCSVHAISAAAAQQQQPLPLQALPAKTRASSSRLASLGRLFKPWKWRKRRDKDPPGEAPCEEATAAANPVGTDSADSERPSGGQTEADGIASDNLAESATSTPDTATKLQQQQAISEQIDMSQTEPVPKQPVLQHPAKAFGGVAVLPPLPPPKPRTTGTAAAAKAEAASAVSATANLQAELASRIRPSPSPPATKAPETKSDSTVVAAVAVDTTDADANVDPGSGDRFYDDVPNEDEASKPAAAAAASPASPRQSQPALPPTAAAVPAAVVGRYERVPAKEPADPSCRPARGIIRRPGGGGPARPVTVRHRPPTPPTSDEEEEGLPERRDAAASSDLAARVRRRDSMARFLENKQRERQQTLSLRRVPSDQRKEERTKIGNALERRLSLRPSPTDLQDRNILHDKSEAALETEKQQKIRFLTRKLSFRPTVQELREKRIIRFNDYVEVTNTEEYDRVIDKPWTRLSGTDKARIRKELNDFKANEMPVHEESKRFTRFHKP
ncbi:hypothetical protein BOX15_Mlig011619g1 [Macrostomum lignano]|uniref:Phosphatase and actin regulator n=1 Tax=Macrostomum lignano TaxID=282301 RepID=A0A267E6P8_9PLAT|nr:hypothetical protein BOX15_Mlig011619g1 [Macrostomum lignano]